MYAIETKKRKFDRVLESINSALPSSPSRISVHDGNETPSPSRVTNTITDLKKKPRLSDEGVNKGVAKKPSTASFQQEPNYLPHSQTAFLTRLSTFASIQNWRISSSEEINAVEWSKRGWTCVGKERVACRGGCEAELLVQLGQDQGKADTTDGDDDEDEDTRKLVEEQHKLLVQKYKELIVSAHFPQCPWRRRGCDASIQRLPLINAQSSVRDLQTRYDSILEMPSELPQNIRLVAEDTEADETVKAAKDGLSDVEKIKSDSDVFRDTSENKWTERNRHAFNLALAGWEPAVSTSDPDVVECRSCFRRLGLWLYRPKVPGVEPTMEHLDAIDSHLDFCPWKSAEAQQTQIEFEGKKQMFPGWILLIRNVSKEVAKITSQKRAKSGSRSRRQSTVEPDDGDSISLSSQFTSEEKEKRAKALVKKIRELKKPFNVKSLLRKKEPTK